MKLKKNCFYNIRNSVKNKLVEKVIVKKINNFGKECRKHQKKIICFSYLTI